MTLRHTQSVKVLCVVLALALSCNAASIGVSCDECIDAVETLNIIANSSARMKDLDAAVDTFCLALNIFPLDVCQGVVREFAPVVQYVFSRQPVPASVCADLRFCTPFGATETSSPRDAFMWRERLVRHRARRGAERQGKATEVKTSPGKPLQPLRKLRDPSIGYAFHISDIHFDPDYLPNTSVDCGYPLCCHGGSGDAGVFGAYGCDPPLVLLHSAFDAMVTALPDPDYVIFTGDVPPSNVWNSSDSYCMDASVSAANALKEYFPTTQILYALGNHEVFPVNLDPGPMNNTWFTQGLQPLWLPWLQEPELETWSHAAYYTTLLTPTLRLVSLDTNYCAFENIYLALSSVNATYFDLGAQLQWLNTTLATARAGGEHVWLIGHIPFFDGGCLDRYAESLFAIISAYPDVLASAFMGHTHHDQVHVTRQRDAQQTPFLPVYVAPSITPESGGNPAFRIYEFNRTTGEVLDYVQYIGNISDVDENGPAWQVEYSAKSRFALPDLSPVSWTKFLTGLIANATALNDYCDLWWTGRGAEGNCGTPEMSQMITCSFFTRTVSEMVSCLQQQGDRQF